MNEDRCKEWRGEKPGANRSDWGEPVARGRTWHLGQYWLQQELWRVPEVVSSLYETLTWPPSAAVWQCSIVP